MKRMGNKFKVQKVSDRFKVGVSDWLIFHEGLVIAIEAKYIQKVPATAGNRLLRHTVTGPQRTYLKTLAEAKVPSWVIVGIGGERKVVVVPFSKLPVAGNWTVEEFTAEREVLAVYPYGEIPLMLTDMFAHAAGQYRGRCSAT